MFIVNFFFFRLTPLDAGTFFFIFLLTPTRDVFLLMLQFERAHEKKISIAGVKWIKMWAFLRATTSTSNVHWMWIGNGWENASFLLSTQHEAWGASSWHPFSVCRMRLAKGKEKHFVKVREFAMKWDTWRGFGFDVATLHIRRAQQCSDGLYQLMLNCQKRFN